MNGFGAVGLNQDVLSLYKCDGNSAVHLKLVRNEKDVLNEEGDFHPEFSHQFFGDNETIFGYKNLKVQLYYHAGSLLTYLNMTHCGEVNSSISAGVQPDPVLKSIAEYLPPGYLSNLDEFIAKLPGESSFRPSGELLHQYSRNDAEYQVYKPNINDEKYQEYYNRLQTFTLWYIDAASFIDLDDEKWDCFLLYEKRKVEGSFVFNLVGYISVYNYYAYPDKTRPRVGHMLVLPPYQRHGHGAQFLETVVQYYIKNSSVLDISVEDPSTNFIQLRDYVDCMACAKLPAFQPEKLHSGFSEEMIKEAKEKRKICKRQCRRVYEILKLHVTDLSNPEQYRKYRLEIKNRLNAPFQREKADREKLKKVLQPEEYKATVENNQERLDLLDHAYHELEKCYRKTLEKMAAS